MLSLRKRVEAALATGVKTAESIGGGHGATVYRVRLSDGREVVAKAGGRHGALQNEAMMLRRLKALSTLPVPEVLFDDAEMLIMSQLPGRAGAPGRAAQEHAATLIAALHGISAPQFGFGCDTVLGGLSQNNTLSDSWLAFFRDRRLLPMAADAHGAGALEATMRGRVDRLADRLSDWLTEPAPPSLIHGDLWGGNVLSAGDHITGFIDPAIYYADAEIELAFTALFDTFGDPFFRAYNEIRPIRAGFFEARRDLYNLYPLLVHVRLFGAAYLPAVDRILRRFGV